MRKNFRRYGPFLDEDLERQKPKKEKDGSNYHRWGENLCLKRNEGIGTEEKRVLRSFSDSRMSTYLRVSEYRVGNSPGKKG